MTRTTAHELIAHVLDTDSFHSWDTTPVYGDISESYQQSLAKAREKSGVDESVITGEGTIYGHRVAVVLSEFNFLGGSIGAATARRIIAAIHKATEQRLPLLISPSSGGTRMQEGTPAFALMVSITTAVYRHKDAHLPYLVYLRNPTTGGVMASWGSAGHFTFAEPNALLGFLGPRVVELTTGRPLTQGVQSGENLAEKGVIDGVISPRELRASLKKIVEVILSPADVTTTPHSDPCHIDSDRHSVWESIEITRHIDRPGARSIMHAIGRDNYVQLFGSGDGRRSPAVIVAVARLAGRSVVIIAQDRHAQPPHATTELSTEALRCARRGIQLAHELQLPLISIIDTPGAELSDYAEEHGLAGSIARTLGELVSVDVPTLSLILGQGCGGGALAMLPADKVLATSHAWLSPLPPEGASAIIYRDTSHAAQMMEEQQVSAVTLKEVGIINTIIDEPVAAHQHPDAFATFVLEKVTAALAELDDSPAVGRESRLQRYEKLAHTLI